MSEPEYLPVPVPPPPAPAPDEQGPLILNLLDTEDLVLILGVLRRYAERHGLSEDQRRTVNGNILMARLPAVPQYDDETGELVGHLVLADPALLMAKARQHALDALTDLQDDGREPPNLL